MEKVTAQIKIVQTVQECETSVADASSPANWRYFYRVKEKGKEREGGERDSTLMPAIDSNL